MLLIRRFGCKYDDRKSCVSKKHSFFYPEKRFVAEYEVAIKFIAKKEIEIWLYGYLSLSMYIKKEICLMIITKDSEQVLDSKWKGK